VEHEETGPAEQSAGPSTGAAGEYTPWTAEHGGNGAAPAWPSGEPSSHSARWAEAQAELTRRREERDRRAAGEAELPGFPDIAV
jgi:hypothetical protein